MAQAESNRNLWRNKETFLCHYCKKWKQCFLSPIRWYLYQSLWITTSTHRCVEFRCSAQGKVTSPLQCPGGQGSELGVTWTLPKLRAEKGWLSKKKSITVCCLWQGGTAVPGIKVLRSLHTTTERNPAEINKKGIKVLPAFFYATGYFQHLDNTFLIQSGVTKSASC